MVDVCSFDDDSYYGMWKVDRCKVGGSCWVA